MARLLRPVTIAAAAMSLFAVLPTVASAKDYCVVPNTGCGGTNVDTFAKALDLADDDPDADRILLGAFSYVAPSTAGFDYSKSGAPVEIVGKGAGQTTLTGPGGASGVLRLFGSAASSVRDLTIDIPDNVAADFKGLSTDGIARRIDVTENASQQPYQREGVYLENGGALEDSSVKLNGATPYTKGVWIDAGGGSVRGSTVVAFTAIASRYGAHIERTRILTSGGALAAGGGTTTIENSVIRLFQTAVGIAASAQPGFSPTINADGLTIVGADRAATRAVVATTFGVPDQSAYVNMTNSIVQSGHLEARASGAGHAEIAISYSDFDPGANDELGTNAHISAANTSNVADPGFADPKLGDYHLLPSSPLIDAGDPNTAAGSDLDGKPRLIDGNGDGIARRDIGAFEYGVPAADTPPPTGNPGGGTPVDTLAPIVTGFRASRVRVRYTLSEAARVTVRIQRRRAGGRYARVGTLRRTGAKGANKIRFSGKIGRRVLRPGRYRAVIAATDTAGNRSTPRKTRFRIARKWAV